MRNELIIHGGKKLYGEYEVQTSKNATLPILSACLLNKDSIRLKNLPQIVDVNNMLEILKNLGAKITNNNNDYDIDVSGVKNAKIDENLAKSMRSSIFLLGSLLVRFKQIMITTPGGCPIGKRPIDLHIKALKKLGVKVAVLGENVFFNSTNAHAGKIKLKLKSVGVTENIIQFSTLLKGKTTITNPAREPEVEDLIRFINSMGGKIIRNNKNKITIYGVDKLNKTKYTPIPDRIVAGTILCAVAICGGNVTIKRAKSEHNEKLLKILSNLGCQIQIKSDIITIESTGELNNIKKLSTGFYPKFPTDLQSFIFVLATLTKGKTHIIENLFENRFLITDELKKMGAKINILSLKHAVIEGVEELKSNELIVKDLRGGASLVIASLIAKGESKIKNVEIIDRGYEKIEKLFSSLGADIVRKWKRKSY